MYCDERGLRVGQARLGGQELLAVGLRTTRQGPYAEDCLRQRFLALIERLGGDHAGADAVFQRLDAAWGDAQRRYHNRQHLLDCLRELDAARVEPARADVAELALWYHDAVYDPFRNDNEERSAGWLLQDAAALGIPRRTREAAAACVRATAHRAGAVAGEPVADLVNDIDLAILGRDALRFLEFEYSIAEEYAHVWAPRFFVGRGRLLEALLAAPAIYRTPHFSERYEARARAQLGELLASRRYWLHRWASRVRRWCRGWR